MKSGSLGENKISCCRYVYIQGTTINKLAIMERWGNYYYIQDDGILILKVNQT